MQLQALRDNIQFSKSLDSKVQLTISECVNFSLIWHKAHSHKFALDAYFRFQTIIRISINCWHTALLCNLQYRFVNVHKKI